MSIKHFSLEYNQLNKRRTFSPGDVLSGRVFVVASKETRVQLLVVKAKGTAEVKWYGQDGGTTVHHQDEEKYFYMEHIIIQDKNKGDGSEIIRQGKSVYPFTFKIPNKDMPSSYEGKWGRITYSLQAQLTQSIWSIHKTRIEFPFLTKSEFPFASTSEMLIIGLKERQSATKISFYGSGKVTLNVTSEKMGLTQGQQMEVSVEVINGSNSAVTPKFFLCEKQIFVAQSETLVHTNEILFGSGQSVAARTSRTISNVLSIPMQLHPTFCNCSVIKLEYMLKVILGDPLARDPDIKLPVVILLGPSQDSYPYRQNHKRSMGHRSLPN
ncbi:arrestin domain-containing protein 3-like [Corythoichthys intestinalis]|uniref:arrestin domain-containing protein 3-like n=1 Tax=Corythoichthys intestinalis TaxID=161448 RepID=UPI0025A554AF|nr:arrestin domain-containing protein 3-like [Corythoichthys intestinalis]XP_061803934.1 arrestin domain-containing protein 3-like [Nerophis lumbriciformis]